MRPKIKSLFVLLVAMITSILISGCSDVIVDPDTDIQGAGVIIDYKYKARKPFLYIVNLTTQTSFKLESINGSVDVQSVSGTNLITISGEKVVSSDLYQDAVNHLGSVSVQIDEMHNELVVKTDQPKFSNGRSYYVNYTINVPSNLSVTVKNVNGKLTGKLSVPSNGTVDMNLSNGSIELNIPQSTSADFSASLVNGGISVQNLALKNKVETKRTLQGRLGNGEGFVTLRTTNGNIAAIGY